MDFQKLICFLENIKISVDLENQETYKNEKYLLFEFIGQSGENDFTKRVRIIFSDINDLKMVPRQNLINEIEETIGNIRTKILADINDKQERRRKTITKILVGVMLTLIVIFSSVQAISLIRYNKMIDKYNTALVHLQMLSQAIPMKDQKMYENEKFLLGVNFGNWEEVIFNQFYNNLNSITYRDISEFCKTMPNDVNTLDSKSGIVKLVLLKTSIEENKKYLSEPNFFGSLELLISFLASLLGLFYLAIKR